MTRPTSSSDYHSGLEGGGREHLQAGARKAKRWGRLHLGAPRAAEVDSQAVRGGGGVTGLSRQRLFVCSAYVNTYVVNEATFGNKYWLRGLMPSCHLL